MLTYHVAGEAEQTECDGCENCPHASVVSIRVAGQACDTFVDVVVDLAVVVIRLRSPVFVTVQTGEAAVVGSVGVKGDFSTSRFPGDLVFEKA